MEEEWKAGGTAGRTTGWERHSLRSVRGVKVGKVRVQTLGMGGYSFMLTRVCVSKERQRGQKHWGFELRGRRKFVWSSVCVCSWHFHSTLTTLKAVERVTSRRGVSLGCWHGRICQEHFWLHGGWKDWDVTGKMANFDEHVKKGLFLKE